MSEISYENALSPEGYVTSELVSHSNNAKSYIKGVMRPPETPGVQVGIWKAEPGEFSHPGGPDGETFIVIQGSADVLVGDDEPTAITAGSIVKVPPNTPTSMRIHETLYKTAIIVSHT